MPAPTRGYEYGVTLTLNVNTTVAATAATSISSALTAINSALATAALGAEVSLDEYPQGTIALQADSGGYSTLSGLLLVTADAIENAQSVAESSIATINTALVGTSPAVTAVVALGEGGVPIVQQLG